MTFAAVVRSEVADGVAEQIRDAILAGEYQPGDPLPSSASSRSSSTPTAPPSGKAWRSSSTTA